MVEFTDQNQQDTFYWKIQRKISTFLEMRRHIFHLSEKNRRHIALSAVEFIVDLKRWQVAPPTVAIHRFFKVSASNEVELGR